MAFLAAGLLFGGAPAFAGGGSGESAPPATDDVAPARSGATSAAPAAGAQGDQAQAGQGEEEKKKEEKSDEGEYRSLDTIVVSADRGVPLTYPGGRDVVEPETLQKYPEQSISTVLRRVPGVYFLPENENDSRIHVGLRGNDPRRSGLTAVLVDGIPIAEAPYGNTDIDGMPLTFERIWKIDVIRGGASIRYGPNAAGGVIDFLTEPIPDRPMIRVGARAGSFDTYGESIAAGGTYGRLGVLVTGVNKTGDGFRDNSSYKDDDANVKVRYALSDHETLAASVSRFVEPDAKQPGGLTQAAYDQDPTQSLRHGSNFVFDTNRYVLDYTNREDSGASFQARAWFQNGTRVLNDFRPIVAPFTQERTQSSDFSSGALEARYTWSRELFGVENDFYHSFRYLVEENDEFYYRRPIGGGPLVTPFELHALFRGRAFSLFNEDRIALTKDVAWGLGFRVESIVMDGLSRDSGDQIVKDYAEFLPESNLTWTVLPQTSVYANWQQSFYPPQYETGFDPASVLYAPTRPESSNAYELGVRTREVDGLEASLALFQTDFSDKIDFLNTPSGKVPVNSGDARSRGVELGLAYDLGAAVDELEGLSVYGSYTEQRSEILNGVNEGNDTPDAPHRLASWGLEYQHHATGLWGRLGGSYTAMSYRDPANTPVGTPDGLNGPVPGASLWDAALGWSQHPDTGDGLALSVGVTNIFSEDYFRRFATGIYPGAPREYFGTISYTVHL